MQESSDYRVRAEDMAFAERMAREDATEIDNLVHFGGSPVVAGEVACIVDGSQFSPSWRRLDGGAAVWSRAIEELREVTLCEVYSETLDRAVDAIDCQGGSLYWEDGCLFLSGPDAEDPALSEDTEPFAQTFNLSISMGNDAMRTPMGIASALRSAARRIEDYEPLSGTILDANGNTVGEWSFDRS
jgi:hypothetical protein